VERWYSKEDVEIPYEEITHGYELTCDLDPEKHKDRYRARLKRVVDRKRKGETIKLPEDGEQPDRPSDLMDPLERTLAELQARS
jgi:non-homologous end joining protein Ku